MRIRTRVAIAALPLTAALTLTGCGGSDGGDGVASANDGKKAKEGSSSTLSPDEMAQKFAECLRKNDLEVEDPKPGRGVELNFKPDTPETTVDKAMKACGKYDPAQSGGANKGVSKEIEDKLRKYSQCMRKNGVTDFPDPVPGGGLQLNGAIEKDPDYKKADKACKDLMPGGGEGSKSTEEG